MLLVTVSSPSTASSPGGLNNVGVSGTQASPVPPQVPGHHRTSSAPPAPQPPPMSLATPSVAPVAPPCPPPCPPLPPQPISTSVEPEASMSRSNSSDNQDPGSLAAQLQSARLRRANKVLYCFPSFRIFLHLEYIQSQENEVSWVCFHSSIQYFFYMKLTR